MQKGEIVQWLEQWNHKKILHSKLLALLCDVEPSTGTTAKSS